jgi:RNA-directed DNA polymerase
LLPSRLSSPFLRGWANYFRYGNGRLHFTRITTYALRRLALFVAKRHQRASGYGMTVVACVSPNRMGLVTSTDSSYTQPVERGQK